MAGVQKVEFPPLLPVGFHPVDVAGVRRLCVDRFPSSITRPRIMRNLSTLIDLINRQAIRGQIWIDGSFLTEKLNPDDVDMIFIVGADVFHALTDEQKEFFDWYRETSLKDQYDCDNYARIDDRSRPENEWMAAYWLRQFGFSRSEEMKGLAVVTIPFVVMP